MKIKEQQTLVLIKPDGLVKSLTGNIITELSDKDLIIVGAKIVQVTRELAEEHYQHLKEEKFFDELIKYIMGEFHVKRVLALVYHGKNAIEKVRKVIGETNPEKAEPTTIRGKYGRITSAGVFENVVHASESEKEELFREFWKHRDPTPDTEENEIKDEFYRRIDFCNQNFTVFMLDKEGWETDRGKIFLKYGEPSQVEKHESDLNRPAIEVWYFEKLQQRFIFADRSGMGDYQLIKIE